MLCNNQAGRDGAGCGREVQERGTCIYLWLIHAMYGRNQHSIVKQLHSNEKCINFFLKKERALTLIGHD